MEASTRAIGRKINRMALARRSGIMEQRPMKANSLMGKRTGRENSHGVMALIMKVTS